MSDEFNTEPIHPDHYKENNDMQNPIITPDDRKPGLIDTALMLNDDRIDRLENVLDALIRKIEPVLGPQRVEATDADPGEARQETSKVVRVLDDHARRLYNMEKAVDKVISRVEL